MKVEKRWQQPDAMPNCGRHEPLRAVSIARPPFQAAIAGPVLRAASAGPALQAAATVTGQI